MTEKPGALACLERSGPHRLRAAASGGRPAHPASAAISPGEAELGRPAGRWMPTVGLVNGVPAAVMDGSHASRPWSGRTLSVCVISAETQFSEGKAPSLAEFGIVIVVH